MSLQAPVSFAGVGGNVSIGTNVGISVREWKLTVAGDAIDVTSTADFGWKTNIVGPVGGEGTFKINADCNEYALQEIIPEATTCNVISQLCTLELGTSSNSISFQARITKAEITNPAEEEVSIEYSFVTTGMISFLS